MEPAAPLSLADWPTALVDSDLSLEVDSKWTGHVVRHDHWRAVRQVRPWHILYLLIEGEHQVDLDGTTFRAAPGTWFWCRAGTPITLDWGPGTGQAEVWFRLRDGAQTLNAPAVPPLHHARDLLPTFHLLADEIRRRPPRWEERVRLLLAAMLVDVERRLSAAALGTAGLTMQQRLAVEATLRTNPLRTLTPYTLAKAAGLTADWFARRFAISYGCSPRTWIANQRLGMAARLLRETDLAVGDIARRLGYGRPEPFTRRFSSMFGCPPLTYRKRGTSPG